MMIGYLFVGEFDKFTGLIFLLGQYFEISIIQKKIVTEIVIYKKILSVEPKSKYSLLASEKTGNPKPIKVNKEIIHNFQSQFFFIFCFCGLV